MLTPSRSHWVTFRYVKFHLPIGFPLSLAGEVFLQDQTILKWMYIPIQDTVVCEQANGRPDVIRQIIYEDEEQEQDLT